MAERKRRRRRPLRAGEAIAAGSAISLFMLLFSSWYDFEYTGAFLILLTGMGRNAWDNLDVIAPLLALISALSFGLVLARLLKPDWRPAIAPGAAVTVLGGIATLLVIYRLLVLPGLGELSSLQIEISRSLGAYLSLAAALGVAVGGYRVMREEESSFAAVADSLRVEPRQREDRGGEGKDAGRPPKRAH